MTSPNPNDKINMWSELHGQKITEDDYLEICRNLGGFFGILDQWNREPNTLKGESK